MALILVNQQLVQSETGDAIVDLDGLMKGICRELHDQVDPSVVLQILVDLLPRYQNARIFNFIPVLLRRDALEMLRHAA